MKILKIKAKGLPLFNNEIEIDFIATQRIMQEKKETISEICSNVCTNNIVSLFGINASGKTTTLKVVSFIVQLLNNKPISNITTKDILINLKQEEFVEFEIVFAKNNNVYRLNTKIQVGKFLDGEDKAFEIVEEQLCEKAIKTVKSKKEVFEFNDEQVMIKRDKNNQFLLSDVSIMVAFNNEQKSSIPYFDLINWTNVNAIRILGNFPTELVQYLDPNIEYITTLYGNENCSENDFGIKLKFKNRELIEIKSLNEVSKYLSSGTVKGINVFLTAIYVLKEGGYLIVDELENHFNIEIVSTLIGLFGNSSINISGATIVFSTHYLELLDEVDRSDSIYFIKNENGIGIKKFSDVHERDDKKRSQYIKSGTINNTMPSYNNYINFIRAIKSIKIKGDKNETK